MLSIVLCDTDMAPFYQVVANTILYTFHGRALLETVLYI